MSSVTEANTSTLGKQGETLFRLLDWLALQTRCSFLRKTGRNSVSPCLPKVEVLASVTEDMV